MVESAAVRDISDASVYPDLSLQSSVFAPEKDGKRVNPVVAAAEDAKAAAARVPPGLQGGGFMYVSVSLPPIRGVSYTFESMSHVNKLSSCQSADGYSLSKGDQHQTGQLKVRVRPDNKEMSVSLHSPHRP
ncbi:10174_t:CDS:2 [Acaulospora colombiana]|uniref:10174_t:CDS:1 n=1 Tax=Acaulospora colombiana TaxID=27376 RepID=A0ACA9MG15_9GLOM|nr:10174_t:CDS:2 [Acaulospora colombiana]